MNLALIEDVGDRLVRQCSAKRSDPGTRWIIGRRRGPSIHIILNRGNDPERFQAWIIDPSARLGQTATYVKVPEDASIDEFIQMVCRTVGEK